MCFHVLKQDQVCWDALNDIIMRFWVLKRMSILFSYFNFIAFAPLYNFLYFAIMVSNIPPFYIPFLALAEQEQTTCHCTYNRVPSHNIGLRDIVLCTIPCLVAFATLCSSGSLSHLVKHLGSHHFLWVWTCYTQHNSIPPVSCHRDVCLLLWWSSHTVFFSWLSSIHT